MRNALYQFDLGRLKDRPRGVFAGSNGVTGMVESHGRFVWYELMTTNVDMAKAFYADVVGWGAQRISVPGSAYSLLTAGDSPVAELMSLPEEAARRSATPHWTGYVEVDDVDGAVEMTKRFGGTVYVPPTNVPGVSRFAIVADPQMATLAVVKGLKPRQEPLAGLGAPGRVGWHELLAADWEKAFAFYSALFGWRKSDGHVGLLGAYQGFAAGATTIGGMFTKPPTLPHPFWLYYFNVADVEAAANRVEARGGQILYGPLEAPGAPGSRIAPILRARYSRCWNGAAAKRSDIPCGGAFPARQQTNKVRDGRAKLHDFAPRPSAN